MHRFEVYLVPNRFFQKKCVYHSETDATVVPFEVLLLFVKRFSSEGCHVHQADVFDAFQNGYVNGGLYMSRDNGVYEFARNIYGLNQSLCLSYKMLKESLEGTGFKQHAEL